MRKAVWIIVTTIIIVVSSIVSYRLGSFFRESKQKETIPGNMVARNDSTASQELPDQTKVDLVKPVDSAADPAPKIIVEPVDIEGVSDEAWKSARIITRPNGSTMGVSLSLPARTQVSVSVPKGLSASDLRFNPVFVKRDGQEAAVASWGMQLYHPEHRDGRTANQFGMVSLGADQKFVPEILSGKVSLTVSDPRGLVFTYPASNQPDFGNFSFDFLSNQKFVQLSDKKLFVRLYIEWMARHPSRSTNTSEPVDLLSWWNTLNQK